MDQGCILNMAKKDKEWWMSEIIKPIYSGLLDLLVKNPFVFFFIFLLILLFLAYILA